MFLVFGSLLFSCTDHKSGKFETVEIVDFNKESSIDGLMLVGMQSSPVDSVNAFVEASLQDTLAEESKQQKFSEEVVIPEIYSEEMMTGDMVYVEEYVDGGLIVEEKQSDAIPMNTVNLDEVPIVDYMKPLIDASIMTGKVSIIEYSNCFNHRFNIDSVSVNNEVSSDDLEMTPVKNDFNLFPNPSNGEFTIRYVLQKSSDVNLTINNMNGVLLTTFVDVANQYEGKYHMPVNLNELPNGIYLVTLIVNDKKLVKRLVIER
ncbi:MAG: T9SS type A sorting domain-containing protein [Burkholderiales bacterium]|nr:T9SS type A sorting domain-containing protein [Bacteroidia bacterium]